MKIPFKQVSTISRGFGWWFKMGFFFLFLIGLTFQAVALGIESRDMGVTFQIIGQEIMNPLLNLQESQEVNWGYFHSLYTLVLWFSVIMLFINFLMKDSNSPLIRYLVGVVIFSFILIIYSTAYLHESVMYPFDILKNAFQNIYRMILGLDFQSSMNMFKPNNSCLNETCVM